MYENAFENTYKELRSYYPMLYWEFKEMDAIWRSMGDELDNIQNGIVSFVLNNYIQNADEEVLARWEKFLWITYDGERTLNDRRSVILQFFNGYGHIGEQEIKEIIWAFTVGDIVVELIGGTINITVTRDLAEKFILSDCMFILKKRIPAHLGIEFMDVWLPIRFHTGNVFFLRRIKFLSSFYNYSDDIVILNGRHNLDGLWKLNQSISSWYLVGFYMNTGIGMQYGTPGIPSLSIQLTAFEELEILKAGDLTFSTDFYNYPANIITLTGRKLLDGSWLLNQDFHISPDFPLLKISSQFIPNCNAVECTVPSIFKLDSAINENRVQNTGVQISASIFNYSKDVITLSGREKLDGSWLLNQDFHFGPKLNSVCIAGSFQMDNRLEASLIIDSLYHLDGSYLLDGTRKLNARQETEEI